MKEIIYIQAGSLANYTGTHFWNTQESYFTYDDSEDPLTTHDISFREGLDLTGNPTYCPRLLIFDRKANFGTLARNNALIGAEEEGFLDADKPILWNGDVSEFRQEPIPKSGYYEHMDESGDHEPSNDGPNNTAGSNFSVTEDIRFWSDFNHVFYVPRTVQKIPDPADWENADGDWIMGQEAFARYNEDADLMEGPLRLFLEECDSIQGIQIMNDTDSFGAFIHSFLTTFRDEFLKLPSLVFPCLSDAVARHIDIDDYRCMRKMVNEALFLRGLNELSSMSVPIASPKAWPDEAWGQPSGSDRNMYHNSAILAAHIETSTLPLRVKGTGEDIASFSSQLNWRGTTPFGQLCGIFPLASPTDLETCMVDFAPRCLDKGAHQYTRRDVTRGFSSSSISAYDTWSAGSSLHDSLISRFHAPAYPLTSTFFKYSGLNTSRRPGILKTMPSVAVFSSISTTNATSGLFSTYAKFMETCIRRRTGENALGIDSDDLKELASDLWTLHDNFSDDNDGERSGADDENALGEDE